MAPVVASISRDLRSGRSSTRAIPSLVIVRSRSRQRSAERKKVVDSRLDTFLGKASFGWEKEAREALGRNAHAPFAKEKGKPGRTRIKSELSINLGAIFLRHMARPTTLGSERWACRKSLRSSPQRPLEPMFNSLSYLHDGLLKTGRGSSAQILQRL